jgi:hypothetical protein
MKRVAAIGQNPNSESELRAGVIRRAKLGGVMTLTAFLAAACADMPIFHTPAEVTGFATKPAEGADFVKASRPEQLEFTSVGVEPGHPPDKPRDAAGVKKLQSELEAQRDAGHAILQKLAPEAAAAADEKAKAAAAKHKQKQKTTAEKPQNQTQGQAPASE